MGKMPEKFGRAGARNKPEFFKEGAKLAWPNPKATRQSKKEVRATKSLQVYLALTHGLVVLSDSSFVVQEIILSTDSLNRNFLDLVRKLLTFDPAHRITVAEALKHPYFSTKPPLD